MNHKKVLVLAFSAILSVGTMFGMSNMANASGNECRNWVGSWMTRGQTAQHAENDVARFRAHGYRNVYFEIRQTQKVLGIRWFAYHICYAIPKSEERAMEPIYPNWNEML
jgi:hypothetical protein